jgi:periplasmic protein TonB
MEIDPKKNSDFDDIVFTHRNKEYGAYLLRKKYSRNVTISTLVGIIIAGVAIIIPYLNARALDDRQRLAQRQVEIKLENLEQPVEQIVLPPPPPPPSDVVQQQKYIPPVVVDTVKPEDNVQLMTADEAQTEVTNSEVIEIKQEVKEEVQEETAEPEPFLSVEEMPEPPGGIAGLFKYIADNTKYPEVAKDNNIQGKVYVRFCVTSKGTVEQVSILKSVDPELDAEALRVVKTFPTFKPGRQSGKPVPVWFTVFINFQLN